MDGRYCVLRVSIFLYWNKIFLNISHVDLTNDSLYTNFIDNQRTAGYHSVIFGVRELNSTEIEYWCANHSIGNSPPMSDQPFNFTSNYELRTYTSGCYYLNSNNNWQSDGLVVSVLIIFIERLQHLFHSGWISDKSLSDAMFRNPSNNIRRWFSSFTSAS